MSQDASTLTTYRRLFGTFARPYLWRLVFGVAAGLVIGGTDFGVTMSVPSVVQVLQGEDGPAAGREPAPSVVDAARQTEHPDSASSSKEPAEVPQGTQLKGVFGALQRVADWLGIPLEDKGGVSLPLVILLVVLMLALFLAQSFAVFVNRYMLRWVGARVVADIRLRLFHHLQRQSLAFYGQQDVGKLISRCTYDIALVENVISNTFADIIQAPLAVLAPMVAVVFLIRGQGLLGLLCLLLLVLPLCIVPVSLLGRVLKRYAKRTLAGVSVLVSRMQETFTGIRVVKAFDMEEHETARFSRENESYFRVVIRALAAEILMAPLMQFVAISVAAVFVVLCYLRHVDLPTLGAVVFAATKAYKPIKLLAKVNVQLQRCAAASDRIFELLDTDTSLPTSPNPVRLEGFSSGVVFEDVGFAYDPHGQRVLDNIRFEMPRGSVVAFVGATGSGKSTIANLVARFYDPTEGRILLDGHDLRDVEVEDLRRLVGIVTQDTILFNDTVANNIRYGRPEATMEEVVAAAKQANAHQFIVADPEGYERSVGEKGCRLSGGEKQRVAIARAILKNPPILILDEATSALDTATEQLVQEAINHVMADRTTFAIAHRLSTIKHADQILVLDHGKVVERGTHEELLARGGRYHKLCEIQFS